MGSNRWVRAKTELCAQTVVRAEWQPSATMSVPAEVRQRLAAARRAGGTFETAWPAAVAQALELTSGEDRNWWRVALDSTKPTWRAAWRRTTLPVCGSLTLLLQDDIGGRTLP